MTPDPLTIAQTAVGIVAIAAAVSVLIWGIRRRRDADRAWDRQANDSIAAIVRMREAAEEVAQERLRRVLEQSRRERLARIRRGHRRIRKTRLLKQIPEWHARRHGVAMHYGARTTYLPGGN